MCSACSTQVAEPPESYRLCPECLESLEKLVDRGLTLQARNVSLRKAWLGASAGGALALVMWLVAVYFVDLTWYSLASWISYVNCGILSAFLAIYATGDRRGKRVTAAAMSIALLTILVGQYLSADIWFFKHLSANPAARGELVEAGVVSPHQGWWLPTVLVIEVAWRLLGWKECGVIVAALYVAYALTHRGRLWKSHENRPFRARN